MSPLPGPDSFQINPMLRYPSVVARLFSASECQQIIQTCLSYPIIDDPAIKMDPHFIAGSQGKRRLIDRSDDNGWILQRIMPAAAQLNHQHYHFDIQGVEMPHFCEYKTGQGSGWHLDFASDATTNRKLTLLLFLSDPTQFEGGQFHCHPHTERSEQLQGNLFVFPAYLLHTVEPVIQGIRYSLISWGIGPAFR